MEANQILKDYLVPRTKPEDISPDFVNVERVIRSKNPRLAKTLPAFLIRLMERVIHQKRINNIIYGKRNTYGVPYIHECLNDFGITFEVEGLENVDLKGRYLIASNHPLGGIDGLILIAAISKVRPDIVFPVNDLLLNVPQLQPFFVPVNKHGSNARNRELFDAAFESDYMVLYFPAGLVSRRKKGVIRDPEWKKTFISKAVNYKRDILPVHIDGKNSGFFYSFANWRVRLGIKANLEMVLLPDEMFRPRQKHFRITIGKPVSWETFDRSRRPNVWAKLMQEHVYRLKDGLDDFEGLIK